ncbi:MAG: hypothetical protein WA294_20410 [Acidobacteriaceae bacterium]
MPTMNISLPESLRQFVEEQIGARGYGSASEYFRELVRTDQKRQAREALEVMLLEAMREPGETMTPAAWQGLRKEAAGRPRKRAAS